MKNKGLYNNSQQNLEKCSHPSKRMSETCPSFKRGHVPSSEDVSRLYNLSRGHVESFDFLLDMGLTRAIDDIPHSVIDIIDRRNDIDIDNISTIRFWVENIKINSPTKTEATRGGRRKYLIPRDCRELSLTYAGSMLGDFCFQTTQRRNGNTILGKVTRLQKNFGNLPIMVMSTACNLKGKTPTDLANLREEQNEFGGYFLVRGIERCVRFLQIPRRNHPIALQRSSYRSRGPTYTDIGVTIRCARHCDDQTSITNTLHYLTTGSVTLKFLGRRQEFLIPIVLIIRALSKAGMADHHFSQVGQIGITDQELYRRIVQGDQKNTFLRARVELLLQEARTKYANQNTPNECLAYLGERFRNLAQLSESASNVEVGHFLIRRYILVHIPEYKDKLECLIFALRKLYAVAAGDCAVDNSDSLQNQELLLPGHLIVSYLKDRFEEMFKEIRLSIQKDLRTDYEKNSGKFFDIKFWSKMVDRHGKVAERIESFLATGNITTGTGLDLMQTSGFTVVAERINFYRFCSHFRAVHRGQFFTEMRTTAIRKLLPDQWGFLCPVHTPDGAPCGLLSHLALKCSVLSYPLDSERYDTVDLIKLLVSLGVSPLGAGGEDDKGQSSSRYIYFSVCIDGKVIGGASARLCRNIVAELRSLKVADNPQILPSLEITLIPSVKGGPYPGLYLFTGAARLVRPVLNRATGKTELIGPMEQPFMDIACLDMDIREGITTHQELDPTNILSLLANLTPYSDYNQSPRNMYQCQMSKQTMGTPAHSLPYRTDNKLYRLQTPQIPVVQTKCHSEFKMDEFPNGTNAVVAVLSYTGFDMEDAMILNKSSVERGFKHASVYKTIKVSLLEEANVAKSGRNETRPRLGFANKLDKTGNYFHNKLGQDGLPEVGAHIVKGDSYCCIVDEVNGRDHTHKHKERESAYVQNIRLLGSESGKKEENRLSLTMRFNRNPVIGDKFASRHGQKGVLSILWPQENMPFSESGITPDLIINPHAFPSRMTIGMLIESMAGKSGALHGVFQDATPFTFHESGDKIAVDYFGEQLQKAGYNYYGSEPLYSGVSGCLMHADLYIGVVFYQRLRHMVSDKYQVRATGPVNPLTHQPIKGRKKGGGVRLGEMERDALLSHGTAFLLHDRLLNCSDKHVAYACNRCGDLLSPTTERNTVLSTGQGSRESIQRAQLRFFCRNLKCTQAVGREGGNDDSIEPIILPYVYSYLINELAAMNIKATMEIK